MFVHLYVCTLTLALYILLNHWGILDTKGLIKVSTVHICTYTNVYTCKRNYTTYFTLMYVCMVTQFSQLSDHLNHKVST
jgi:hypothetical protein